MSPIFPTYLRWLLIPGIAGGATTDSEGTLSGISITLKENDLKTITQSLKDAFDPKLSKIVQSIVTG